MRATAEIVASFKDARIRFYNLPENFGEQSGPNNVGCQKARGEFIAFLNHDDLYLSAPPEATLFAYFTMSSPTWFSAGAMRSAGPNVEPVLNLRGAHTNTSLTLFVPASCWVFRRELMDDIGPWRAAAELYLTPSQDWIFRVFKAGRKIRCTAEVGVICIPSVIVDDSYKDRRDGEQHKYYDLLRSHPDFVPPEDVIARTETRHQRRLRRLGDVLTRQRTWRTVLKTMLFLTKALLVHCVIRTLQPFALHPSAVRGFIDCPGRKGNLVVELRRRRGLPYKNLTTGGISNVPK